MENNRRVNSRVFNVVAGKHSFCVLPIENTTMSGVRLMIQLEDPDEQFLNKRELRWINDPTEIDHWVKFHHLEMHQNMQASASDVIELGSGEKRDLLFKFMTFREVSLQRDVQTSNRIIKERIIRLKLVNTQDQKVFREYNLDV